MAAGNFEGGIGENGTERERSSKRRHDSSDPRTVAHMPGGREGQKAGMIDSLMLTSLLHFLKSLVKHLHLSIILTTVFNFVPRLFEFLALIFN